MHYKNYITNIKKTIMKCLTIILNRRLKVLLLVTLIAITGFAQIKTKSLDTDTLTINGVEVTASKRNPLKNATQQPASLLSAVQIIKTEQIQQTGAVNVIEALKYTTSGNFTQQGRKRKNFISLRGQSMDYAIDGISMYNFMDAPNALSANMVDEIEITRSSNAMLMGYSGLNGVANFKTKTFDKFTTIAEVEYGTFNKIHANLTHGGSFKGFKYALSISKDKIDGPSGLNAAEDMLNISGKVQYNFSDKLEISLQQFYSGGNREFAQMVNVKTADYSVSPTNLAMIWKFDPLVFNITLAKLRFTPNQKSTTELQFYRVDSKRDWNQRSYYVNKAKQVTDSVPPYTTTHEPDFVIGGGLIQTLSLVKDNFLRLALMGSQKTTPTQTNPTGTTLNTNISVFTGTLIDEHNFGRLSVNGGVKLMQNYYKRYAPGSASIYITNQWQPITVSLNAGASYKISSDFIANLLLNKGIVKAPTDGIQRTIVAKDTTFSALADENRFNVDLGIVKYIKNVGELTLTGFYINRKNAYEFTGNLYYDSQGIQREYLHNVDLRTFGVEFNWNSAKFFEILTTNLSGTYMSTTNVSNGLSTTYERAPTTMLNGSLNATKYGFTFSVFGKYTSRYIGDSFLIKTTSTTKVWVGDYVNVDLSLGYAIPKTKVSVYGRVINIGDVRYTTVSPVYPDYGRQFSVGARIKL